MTHALNESESMTVSDHYADEKTDTDSRPMDSDQANRSTEGQPANERGLNVFLVPFDRRNFDLTMDGDTPVDLTRYDDVPAPLSDLSKARFWGIRVGKRNRSAFERMHPGDLLLFYNNKRYVRMGVVGRTFEDTERWVSETFWRGAPSQLIYTVEEYEPLNLSQAAVAGVFGYKSGYYPQGITRVADARLPGSIPAIQRVIREKF